LSLQDANKNNPANAAKRDFFILRFFG